MKRGFLFCILLLPLWCAAVQPYSPVIVNPLEEEWRWRYEEALGDLGVLCVDEAPNGVLWFGCIGSLASYDGETVNAVPFDDSLLSSIRSGKEVPCASAVQVRPDGSILAVVGESVVHWSNGQWSVLIPNVGASAFSSRIVQSECGTIWVSVSRGLWRISEDLKEHKRVFNPRGKERVAASCVDLNGNVWVLAETGNDARLIRIPVQNGVPADKTNWQSVPVPYAGAGMEAKIAAGQNGLIYYVNSSTQLGIVTFDPQTGKWNPFHEKIRAFSLLKRRDGSILAGLNGQIYYGSGETEQVLSPPKEMGVPQVAMSLFETRGDRLWAIGRIGYVYSIDLGTEEWMTYSDLHFQCETDEGVQWFLPSAYNRVISFDSRTGDWLEYGPEDGLNDKIRSLTISSHGFIWAAGSHKDRAAFSVFDGSKWDRKEYPDFAERIYYRSVFEASDGTMWFGAAGKNRKGNSLAGGALQVEVTSDGSVRLLKAYPASSGFPPYVTSFAEQPDGVLWVGSSVLYHYDGETIMRAESELRKENVVAMVVDREQNLWVAKGHYGICRWDGQSWRVFNHQDGLAGLLFFDLMMLDDGTLLASSNQGISRFDGRAWMAHVYPECFAMTKQRSGIKQSRDGAIWLNYSHASTSGRSYYTIRHNPETNPPDTEITEYLDRVSHPGNCLIKWSGKDVASSTPVKDLVYSWRLNDGEWSVFSPELSQSFLNMESGEHVFEVRSRDRAFNVDPTPARIEFTVIPPVWKQPWFIALNSLLIGLIGFFFWRWILLREQRLCEQQEQREAFILRQKEEREAELRGELVSLHESLHRLEEELKKTRKPLIGTDKPKDDPDREFLDQLMGILDEHYSDWDFSREELASEVNMGLRTFQRRLKEVVGYGPTDLIKEFRVTRAAELLTHTSLSVTDVAFKTGHDDSGTFTRIFKKHFGVTPTEYRAEKASS